jgi:hypothetical protein
VLKITVHTDSTGAIVEVEGRLAGAWVDELKGCWNQLVLLNHPVSVNLKAVSFIDPAGRDLLREMHQWGATIAAAGCMTRAIVEEIQRDG